jgi:hypothetical protein
MQHNYVDFVTTPPHRSNFCKNYSIMTFVKINACTGQQLQNSRMEHKYIDFVVTPPHRINFCKAVALVLLLKSCYRCTCLICKFCIVSPQKALDQLHTFRTRSFTSGGNSQKGNPGPGPNPGPPDPGPNPGPATHALI